MEQYLMTYFKLECTEKTDLFGSFLNNIHYEYVLANYYKLLQSYLVNILIN